jgi:hypothetical protein
MCPHPTTRLLLGSVLAVFGVAAQSATVALGEIEAPLSWPIDQEAPVGTLLDRFTFSIGDMPVVFSSYVSTDFNRYSRIPDLQGELFLDGELLVTGDAGPVIAPGGAEAPVRQVSFEPVGLGRGDYELRFGGTVISGFPFLPIGSGYSGQIAFRASSAVPEPPSLLLAGPGIVALTAFRYRGRSPVARPVKAA